MDKVILVSIIAKNGLDTAQAVFAVKAAEVANRAEVELDGVKRRKLLGEARRLGRLVRALSAAETGLNQYLKETAGL